MPKTNYLAALALLYALPACADPGLPRDSRVPGGVALIPMQSLEAARQYESHGRPVLIAPRGRQWVLVVGIPLSTPPGTLALEAPAGVDALEIQVVDKQYRTQQLKVAPGQVNLSPEDEA